ncbi:hypothetical protein DPX16_3111 [Anabarilius grahami]|uniref:Ig-like domain-containing protein n=1 Tax=Anabarilius grahami TaxID=495550 RepID=A0A3N0XPV0_ANAGA|nr:hypothetical protein DPX16_3111 [Anabarilius grahami]
MADKCDLCLLGLIILCSFVTGTGGVDDAHVFISTGENVHLPCNNALSDCSSTTWIYGTSRHSEAAELTFLGIKNEDTGRHERLSLGSDCSLNIKNITKKDYGFYTCRQYVNKQKQGTDACVNLHVLHDNRRETDDSVETVTMASSSDKHFRKCVPPCQRYLTPDDTHHMSVPFSNQLSDCEGFSMKKLNSHIALFSRASVPGESGPAAAEAQWRLRSWGSQVELAEDFERLFLIPLLPMRVPDEDVLSLESFDLVDSALLASSQEEQDVAVQSEDMWSLIAV